MADPVLWQQRPVTWLDHHYRSKKLASAAQSSLSRGDEAAARIGLRNGRMLERAWEELAATKLRRARPGRLYEEIVTDLPRPRDRQSAAFDFAKRRVLAALDRSLDRKVTTDAGETKTDAGAALWW